MRTRAWATRISPFLFAGLIALAGAFSGERPALAQAEEPCPFPEDFVPPPDPAITAQQVEEGSASLRDFALLARDRFRDASLGTLSTAEFAYFGCLLRQEGSAWRSGSTYFVQLSVDGRVFVHAKDMALSGRQINPWIYFEILSALGVSPTVLASLASPDPAVVAGAFAEITAVLSQGPDGPFDATTPIEGMRPGIPGASGYASVFVPADYGVPVLLLVGFDLDSSHIMAEEIDYGDPAIVASDVVDRETLKAFVTEAGNYLLGLVESGDAAAFSKAKVAMRDSNGPWRHGSVYLYILEIPSQVIFFHAAFPGRFELRPLVPTVRDAVTGEFVLPQVLEAAASDPEGGFVEYHFDDPADDTDRADIPKVGYAREFRGQFPGPDGNVVAFHFVIGSGFYPGSDNGTTVESRSWGQVKAGVAE